MTRELLEGMSAKEIEEGFDIVKSGTKIPFRVICTTALSDGVVSIVLLVRDNSKDESVVWMKFDGKSFGGRYSMIRKPQYKYYNLYPLGEFGSPFLSVEKANATAGPDRVCVVRATFSAYDEVTEICVVDPWKGEPK